MLYKHFVLLLNKLQRCCNLFNVTSKCTEFFKYELIIKIKLCIAISCFMLLIFFDLIFFKDKLYLECCEILFPLQSNGNRILTSIWVSFSLLLRKSEKSNPQMSKIYFDFPSLPIIFF